MKQQENKYLEVALVLALATAAQAGTITIAPTDATADVGTLDSATETFTESVTGFNGTDASFDLVVTAVAENGVWIEQNSDLGIASAGSTNNNWDQTGENGDFTVTIANFVAGTSGYTEANVDFGMRVLTLDAANGGSDEGEFDLINGVAPAPALIWTDANAGSDFPGMGENEFDLQVMNGGVRVTSFSLNHAGTTSDDWRLNTLEIEYEFVVISEPATTLAITDIRHTGGTVELDLEGLETGETYKLFRDTILPLGSGSKVQVGTNITGVTMKTEIDNDPPAGEAFYQAEQQ